MQEQRAKFQKDAKAHFEAQKGAKHDLIRAFEQFGQGQGHLGLLSRVFDKFKPENLPSSIRDVLVQFRDIVIKDSKEGIPLPDDSDTPLEELLDPKKHFPNYVSWHAKQDALAASFLFETDLTFQPWLIELVGQENYTAAVAKYGKEALAYSLIEAFRIPESYFLIPVIGQEADSAVLSRMNLARMSTDKPDTYPLRIKTDQSIGIGRADMAAAAIVDLQSSDPQVSIETFLRYGPKPMEHPTGDYCPYQMRAHILKDGAVDVNGVGGFIARIFNDLPDAGIDRSVEPILATFTDSFGPIDQLQAQWNKIKKTVLEGGNAPANTYPEFETWHKGLVGAVANILLDEDLNLKPQFRDAMGELSDYTQAHIGESDEEHFVNSYIERLGSKLNEYFNKIEYEDNSSLLHAKAFSLIGLYKLADLRKDMLLARIDKDIRVLERQLKQKPEGTKGHKLTQAALKELTDMRTEVQNILTERDLMLNPQDGKKPTEHAEKQLKGKIAEHKQIQRLYEAKRKLVTVHDALYEMRSKLADKIRSIKNRTVISDDGKPTKEDQEKADQLQKMHDKVDQILMDIEEIALPNAKPKNLESTEKAAEAVIKATKKLEADVQSQATKHRGFFTTLADTFKQLWAALKGERPGSLSTLGMVKSVAKGMTQLAKRSGFWSPAEATKAGDNVQMQEEQDEDTESKDVNP